MSTPKKGARIKCRDCGHHQTSHYDPVTMSDRDVVCRAVDKATGGRICRCTKTRIQVRREAAHAEVDR